MTKYDVNWKDYRLPTGQDFAMAVCEYNNKVRHMTFGADPLRRMFIQGVEVKDGICSSAEHCLALDCPLNRSEPEHLAHMLDMHEDEPVDKATASLWGQTTALGCLVEMARRFSLELQAEAASQNLKNDSAQNC